MAYYNPLQVETIFQETVRLIAASPSERIQINLIDRFLDFIEGNEQKFESYLTQIIYLLPELPNPLIYAGVKPKTFEYFLRKLEKSLSILAGDSVSDFLSKRIEQYRVILIRMYQWVGVEYGVDSRANALSATISTNLDANNAVLIPVVEEFDGVYSGRLRKLHVEVFAKSDTKFELKPTFGVIGADAGSFIKPVEDAVEFLAAETDQNIRARKASIFFETPHSWHAGKSANLAIAGAFYCELLKAEDLQEQFRINPAACITGEIDGHGNVLPVAYNTLQLKIEAAFYSWVQVLVVPVKQLEEAKKITQHLHNEYPNRDLPVIAVSHLKELFFDRRVSLYHKTDALNHNLKKVWKRKNSAAIVIILITLMVIIGRLVYGPLDRNPVSVEFSGTEMRILNKTGSTLLTKIIEESTVASVLVPKKLPKPNIVDFFDIDKDGINEIIESHREVRNELDITTLYVYNLNGDTLWKKELIFDIRFDKHPYVKEEAYAIIRFEVGDIDSDGTFELVAVTRVERFFGANLSTFDLNTGAVKTNYISVGSIGDFKIIDLNNDGINEVVLSVNIKGFNKNGIIVLDSRYINGNGILPERYKKSDNEDVHEIAAIFIPQTTIGKKISSMYDYAGGYGHPGELRLGLNNQIKVQIYDHFSNSQSIPFYLDFYPDLSVRSLASFDEYDIIGEQLYESGEIDFLPDALYLDSYRDSLLYWNGVSFQSKPTINKKYLDKIGEDSVRIKEWYFNTYD